MCVGTCRHVYRHVYRHWHRHAYRRVCRRVYRHAYRHACRHMSIHMYTCTHVHMSIHISIHMCIHMYLHLSTHMSARTSERSLYISFNPPDLAGTVLVVTAPCCFAAATHFGSTLVPGPMMSTAHMSIHTCTHVCTHFWDSASLCRRRSERSSTPYQSFKKNWFDMRGNSTRSRGFEVESTQSKSRRTTKVRFACAEPVPCSGLSWIND